MIASEQSITVRGQAFRALAPVRSWQRSGFHFLTRMRVETRWVVLHWTGAENSAERCYQNMLRGKKSVHFIVDQLGDVYQCADADARCAHAQENGGNSYGVGIEIINRGHGKAPARGFERPMITESIHGRSVPYADFFPAQSASVLAVVAALCGAYGLPMRAPVVDGRVHSDVLPSDYRESFRGVLGHLHLDGDKYDPGLELLRRVHSTGIMLGLGGAKFG